jgi:outer membrane protein assembly factor BamD
MKKTRMIILGVTAISVMMFSGCASKKEEFNKPAEYWYKEMLKDIARGDLEHADTSFTSLQSEHIRSILIPEAMMMLAEAHIDSEEYVLANYYLDEYIKRYGDRKSTEFARYLKVKAGFLGFKKPLRDQQLLLDTTKDAEAFVKEYPNSIYRVYVDSILVKLYLGQRQLNDDIAGLYGRVGKPLAQKKYLEDANATGAGGIQYEKAVSPWYREAFEMK